MTTTPPHRDRSKDDSDTGEQDPPDWLDAQQLQDYELIHGCGKVNGKKILELAKGREVPSYPWKVTTSRQENADLSLVPVKREPGEPPSEVSSDCSIPVLDDQGEVIGLRARVGRYLVPIKASSGSGLESGKDCQCDGKPNAITIRPPPRKRIYLMQVERVCENATV